MEEQLFVAGEHVRLAGNLPQFVAEGGRICRAVGVGRSDDEVKHVDVGRQPAGGADGHDASGAVLREYPTQGTRGRDRSHARAHDDNSPAGRLRIPCLPRRNGDLSDSRRGAEQRAAYARAFFSELACTRGRLGEDVEEGLYLDILCSQHNGVYGGHASISFHTSRCFNIERTACCAASSE